MTAGLTHMELPIPPNEAARLLDLLVKWSKLDVLPAMRVFLWFEKDTTNKAEIVTVTETCMQIIHEIESMPVDIAAKHVGRKAIVVRRFATVAEAVLSQPHAQRWIVDKSQKVIGWLRVWIELRILQLMNSASRPVAQWNQLIEDLDGMTVLDKISTKVDPDYLTTPELVEMAKLIAAIVTWCETTPPPRMKTVGVIPCDERWLSHMLWAAPKTNAHNLFLTQAYSIAQVAPIVMCIPIALGRTVAIPYPTTKGEEWGCEIRKWCVRSDGIQNIGFVNPSSGLDVPNESPFNFHLFPPVAIDLCRHGRNELADRHAAIRAAFCAAIDAMSPSSVERWVLQQVLQPVL